ncbi:Suppressor of lurcher protein 1 [Eumeta japonica]|uniref:Suppressor of lurcher protein 1 n=1 Tax=Eumeta variegata TaxID=151549 RepID=A0A4C1TMZ3_EUMVA|nr:Suppressor of lurcher protein 1 [Eumeta japonica]
MEFFKWTLTIIGLQGLMMEPEGKHRNSIMKQRILAVFGLVEIVLRCTLTINDFQGLMMQLEGSDNGAGSLEAPSSDPECQSWSKSISGQFQQIWCEAVSASDYVEFSNYMTEDSRYGRYCGQMKDFHVESDRNFFKITFRSNDRLDGTGFRAFYQFLEVTDEYQLPAKDSALKINLGGGSAREDIQGILPPFVSTNHFDLSLDPVFDSNSALDLDADSIQNIYNAKKLQ